MHDRSVRPSVAVAHLPPRVSAAVSTCAKSPLEQLFTVKVNEGKLLTGTLMIGFGVKGLAEWRGP